MTDFSCDAADARAQRATRVISHLNGALEPTMLDALTGTWSVLEAAAVDELAHARAVHARMFWQSLSSTIDADGVEDDDAWSQAA